MDPKLHLLSGTIGMQVSPLTLPAEQIHRLYFLLENLNQPYLLNYRLVFIFIFYIWSPGIKNFRTRPILDTFQTHLNFHVSHFTCEINQFHQKKYETNLFHQKYVKTTFFTYKMLTCETNYLEMKNILFQKSKICYFKNLQLKQM